MRTSSDSTFATASWICAALVTSRVSGVTRPSACASGWRVPAYTRLAPLLKASSTSACPIPRLAPVARTALSAMIMPAPFGSRWLGSFEPSTGRRRREGDLDSPRKLDQGCAPRRRSSSERSTVGQRRGPVALECCPNRAACGDVLVRAAQGAANTTYVGGAMAHYMLLVYQPEVEPAEEAERDAELPMYLEFHRSLREAGLLVGVQRLRSVESATSVRVRGGETEITDGPFAVTKEILAGYYILDCADLDEALKYAARLPAARYGTVEVRPVMPVDEWVNRAREAGADVPDEAVEDLA